MQKTELENCLARAREARAEADAATLDNVRDRALRAESAWRSMAQRAARTLEARDKARADKAVEVASVTLPMSSPDP